MYARDRIVAEYLARRPLSMERARRWIAESCGGACSCAGFPVILEQAFEEAGLSQSPPCYCDLERIRVQRIMLAGLATGIARVRDQAFVRERDRLVSVWKSSRVERMNLGLQIARLNGQLATVHAEDAKLADRQHAIDRMMTELTGNPDWWIEGL